MSLVTNRWVPLTRTDKQTNEAQAKQNKQRKRNKQKQCETKQTNEHTTKRRSEQAKKLTNKQTNKQSNQTKQNSHTRKQATNQTNKKQTTNKQTKSKHTNKQNKQRNGHANHTTNRPTPLRWVLSHLPGTPICFSKRPLYVYIVYITWGPASSAISNMATDAQAHTNTHAFMTLWSLLS